ncbi:MAG: ABC transporter permease [Oscillospiraceae bacterium]|jgi:NitT/TauT family transport system permease protein|nr:ABC transporter permease [Oscillospiraceae bacterium]
MKRFLVAANNKMMGFYLLIAVLILWQIAPAMGWVNPTYIPAISTIASESAVMGAGAVFTHIGISLRRVLLGFICCVAAGLPLAFILGGAIPQAALVLRTLMQFLSQIPAYILYPVITMIWGVGEGSIELVIFWAGFWPILFTTIQGIQDIDPKLIRAAQAMSANPFFLFFKVIIPAVFPNIMRGIRLGMSNCFLILIGAETMGGKEGLGWLISNSTRMAKINRVYLGAFLAAILGFALNFAMQKLESRVTKWKEVPEEAEI